MVTVLEGISAAIDCLKAAADGITNTATVLMTAIMTQHTAIANISNAQQQPKGYDDNKWPQRTSKNFDTNVANTDWAAK